jgi:hypothetical protein
VAVQKENGEKTMNHVKLFENFLNEKIYPKLKTDFMSLPDDLFVHFMTYAKKWKNVGGVRIPVLTISDHYYVSFRDDDPTPLGIYFYPMSFVKSCIKDSSKGLVFDNMYRGRGQSLVLSKFTGNIVSSKRQKYNSKKLIEFEREANSLSGGGRRTVVTDFKKMYSEMSDTEFQREIRNINKGLGTTRSTQSYLTGFYDDRLKNLLGNPQAMLYYKIMLIAEKFYITQNTQPQKKFREICLAIGIDGFIDEGLGFIYTAERENNQAVILNVDSIKIVGMVDKKDGNIMMIQ